MAIWIGLIIAPLLALADLVVSYAVVHWACDHQSLVAVHAVHGAFLVATALCAVVAIRAWLAGTLVSYPTGKVALLPFLGRIAAASAVLSIAAVIAMWVPTWLIATCIA